MVSLRSGPVRSGPDRTGARGHRRRIGSIVHLPWSRGVGISNALGKGSRCHASSALRFSRPTPQDGVHQSKSVCPEMISVAMFHPTMVDIKAARPIARSDKQLSPEVLYAIAV